MHENSAAAHMPPNRFRKEIQDIIHTKRKVESRRSEEVGRRSFSCVVRTCTKIEVPDRKIVKIEQYMASGECVQSESVRRSRQSSE